MKVRLATTDDLRQFDCLWMEYLQENLKAGDTTLNSKNNRAFFHRVARHYMTYPKLGCVVMAFDGKVPAGVVMWGAFIGDALETTLGKVAHGWGTFVRPKYRGEGLSSKMRGLAEDHLRAQRIRSLLGTVLPSNIPGLRSVEARGFKQTSMNVVLDLLEKRDV